MLDHFPCKQTPILVQVMGVRGGGKKKKSTQQFSFCSLLYLLVLNFEVFQQQLFK